MKRFYSNLTEDRVRDGSFASVKEFTDSIVGHLEKCNCATKLYRWRASGPEIRAKTQRDRQASWQREGQLESLAIHYTGILHTRSFHGEPCSLLQRRIHSRD